MRTAAALARVELRRHIPTVITGWALLVPLPLVHRMTEGHWGYWAEWGQAGAAVALLLGLPIMAVALAGPLWAGERESGTLAFFYARPVPGETYFWIRLAGVVVSLALFGGGVLLFHLRSPAELAEVFVGLIDPGASVLFGAPRLPIWFFYLVFGGGAWSALAVLSVFVFGAAAASAVSTSAGRAWRTAALGAVGLALAVTVLFLALARFGDAVLWDARWVSRFLTVSFGLWALAGLAGGLAAVGRAPLDPRRVRRALRAGAVPAVLGFVLLLPLGAHPVGLGSPRVLAVHGLSKDVVLETVRTPGLSRHFAAVRRVRAGTPGPILATFQPAVAIAEGWFRPVGTFAVLQDLSPTGGRWVVVGPEGPPEPVAFPPELDPAYTDLEPRGWSPDGRRFAWEASGAGVLAVLDGPDGPVSTVPLPGPAKGTTGFAWLDGRHVVAVQADRGEPPVQWSVVDTRTAAVQGPFTAPEGVTVLWFPVRFRGRPALLDAVEGGHRLFVLSEDGTDLVSVATLEGRMEAPGELPDGSLAWIADPPPGGEPGFVVRRLEPDGTLGVSCRFSTAVGQGEWWFVDASGSWAVWAQRPGSARSLFSDLREGDGRSGEIQLRACNPATGEVRSVRFSGPLAREAIDLNPERLVGPGLDVELDSDR